MDNSTINPWAEGIHPELLILIQKLSSEMATALAGRVEKIRPAELSAIQGMKHGAWLHVWFCAGCRIWKTEQKSMKQGKAISFETWLNNIEIVVAFFSESKVEVMAS